MPELKQNQIKDKLRVAFAGETRKLVFWYDDKAEFAEDIDALLPDGVKLHRLETNNQFYTKYLLERLDMESSYLIYAPFPKPDVRDNHLEDTLLYSKQFSADRASSIIADLGIDEQHKPIIQRHIKFFAAKDRVQRFYDYDAGNHTQDSIETALLCALCKTRAASFDEMLSAVLVGDGFESNKYLEEFDKFGLLSAFWRLCGEQFGVSGENLTLEKLAVAMFMTLTEKTLRGDPPQEWSEIAAKKGGNVITFLNSLMNNNNHRAKFDEISAHVASAISAADAFLDYPPEALIDCDSFRFFDEKILRWLVDRLLSEDTGARVNGHDIPALCAVRLKKRFGAAFEKQYRMIIAAFHVIGALNRSYPADLRSMVKQYIKSDYEIDQYYRAFYSAYDRLDDHAHYEDLRELVENIYTNEYLARLLPAWNKAFSDDRGTDALPSQRGFYDSYVKHSNDKVVVIISDALRYEVGQELHKKLDDDVNCKPTLDAMMGVLPSVTQFGMAALLPHKALVVDEDNKVYVDGAPCDDTAKREAILRKTLPAGRCVQYDRLESMKKEQLREVFNGMEAVYVYHNRIDACGEALAAENSVFDACDQAVNDLYRLIKRLSGSANVRHFIVTTDHGFIYKRDKLNEHDKIGGLSRANALVDRRFVISDEAVRTDGVISMPLGELLRNDDKKYLSFPMSADVFKAGGGMNYVHGGSSPQEIILPVIDVKTEKGHMDTRTVKIALVSTVHKITNLITSLDFIQSEPVGDVVLPTGYKLYFATENGEKISSECVHEADNREKESQKRIFNLRFNFKSMKYDASKQYYLVAIDEKSGVKLINHGVSIDIAFANDFGF